MSAAPSLPDARVKPGDKRTPLVRAQAMCTRIADGKSLRAAAKLEGMSHASFLHMVAADAELRTLYEAVREVGIEASISEIEAEAGRVMTHATKATTNNAGAYVSAFGHKVAIVKWRAEKQLPKKYGPRVDHTLSGPNGGPVEFSKIERTIVDPEAKP